MKLSTKFILFIIVIHAVTIALSFYIFRENKLLFIASEFFIMVSLIICWSLYDELIAPLKLMMTGIDALHDKDFTIKFVETGRYEMDQLIGVYNTMIDQLRTERTVQQEQHFFLEKLIETSPTGIIILDFDNKIYDLNLKAIEILGIKKQDCLGKLPEVIQNHILKNLSQLDNGQSVTVNTEGVKKFKIQKAHFIDRGFQRSFIMLEELTAEILEAEKKAYGKVIRMMAHEVNNSLGAVNSILDTTYQLEKDADVAQALKIAIERNQHLNVFMRNFADIIRLPEPRKETFDVNQLLEKVASLMSFSARQKNITFRLDFSPSTFKILADENQMEQVFINIIKNAIEAIEHSTGIITFRTDTSKRVIDITDNGKGISSEAQPLLFSPFFTTKATGQGVGLTLIRDILSQHQFAFSLVSHTDDTQNNVITQFRIHV